jgi:predicted transcriptional regulator
VTLPSWAEIMREMSGEAADARPEGARTMDEWAAHFDRHPTNVRRKLTRLVAAGLWERLEGRKAVPSGALHPCVWWRPKAP